MKCISTNQKILKKYKEQLILWKKKYGTKITGILNDNFKKSFPNTIILEFMKEGWLIKWSENEIWIMINENE